jgi:hypothetical protein
MSDPGEIIELWFDDETLEEIRAVARMRGLTMDEVISTLIAEGMEVETERNKEKLFEGGLRKSDLLQ